MLASLTLDGEDAVQRGSGDVQPLALNGTNVEDANLSLGECEIKGSRAGTLAVSNAAVCITHHSDNVLLKRSVTLLFTSMSKCAYVFMEV